MAERSSHKDGEDKALVKIYSRHDVLAWSRNDRRGYDRVWSDLDRMLCLPPEGGNDDAHPLRPLSYATIRVFFPLYLRTAIIEQAIDEVADTVRESFDNWINCGDSLGGQLFIYLRPAISGRPPGEKGEALRGMLSDKNRYRRYIGMDLADYPQRFFNFPQLNRYQGQEDWSFRFAELVRCFFLRRLRLDAPRIVQKERRKPDSDPGSLDELLGQGWEPGFDEPFDVESTIMGTFSHFTTVDASPTTLPVEARLKEALASAVLLAEQSLVVELNNARPNGLPHRFLMETRLFLRYVLDLCRRQGHGPDWPEPMSYTDWKQTTTLHADSPLDALIDSLDVEHRRFLVCKNLPGTGETFFYGQWHQSCLGLADNRNPVDKAKSRFDRRDVLDAFYLVIGSERYDRGEDRPTDGTASPLPPALPGEPRPAFLWMECDYVRPLFRALCEGDIAPDAAERGRSHLQQCPDCFFAFTNYIEERMAWGYVPSPGRAALRERWHYFQRLGHLADDLEELAERVVASRAKLSLGHRPVSQRLTVRAEVSQKFEGFSLQQGQTIPDIPILGDRGQETGQFCSGEVIEIAVDPDRHNASVTIALQGLQEANGVLLMRVLAGELLYSLSGEIQAGRAELSVTDFPEEMGELKPDQWFVALMESAEDFLPPGTENRTRS